VRAWIALPAIRWDIVVEGFLSQSCPEIIAVSAIAMYYVIKNCLIRITSLIEIALEDLISLVYLKEDSLSEESLQAENWSDAVSGITCAFTFCFRSSDYL